MNKLDPDESSEFYESLFDAVDVGLMYRDESYAQLALAAGIDQQQLTRTRIGKATLTAAEFVAVLAAMFPNEVKQFALALATAARVNRPFTVDLNSRAMLARGRKPKAK